MDANSKDELIKKSIRTIRELRRELEHRASVDVPVAVVGMACRFPGGANSPEQFWELLQAGGSGLVDVPPERWNVDAFYSPPPGKPGRSYIRRSNFLSGDVAEFDARFFGISPVEANAMDPQQRVLLEVCWEALEHAGLNPTILRGSATGVFLGINSAGEYSKLVTSHSANDNYLGTGNTLSVASGRISYFLGINGPAISVDTACSSSLVSVLLAAESLRRGECSTALAAGVSLMLAPQVMAGLCAMNALSPDGASKPFDAAADGYGRGEGCGVVVLKRLPDAQRDGDRVLAVIRGGAINNDGESSGLTVPNGNSQRQVLSEALRNARLEPGEIDYLETHGTGTLLGDPIEVDAIRSVYGPGRSERPLILGAVKGNIGHLEHASGVASLIKVILSLGHGKVTPIVGLDELNPRVATGGHELSFPRELSSWPDVDRPRRAAVSSFGFSGTNANVIVEQAPKPVAEPSRGSRTALTVSAKSEGALRRQLEQFERYLSGTTNECEDIAWTANVCRVAFDHRAVVVGSSVEELRRRVTDILAWSDSNGSLYSADRVVLGSSQGRDRYDAKRSLFTSVGDGVALTAHVDAKIPPKLAFVLTGDQAALIPRARELYRRQPAFTEAFDLVASKLNPRVLEEFRAGKPAPDQATAAAWYLCGATAMVVLLTSYGVRPDVVLGDGAGILVSAWASGAISLDDLIRLHQADDVPALAGSLAPSDPTCRFQAMWHGDVRPDPKLWRSELANCRAATMGQREQAVRGLTRQGYRFFVEIDGSMDGAMKSVLDELAAILVRPAANGGTNFVDALATLYSLGAQVQWRELHHGRTCQKVVLPSYPFDSQRHWLKQPEGTDTQPLATGFQGRDLGLPLPTRQWLYTLSLESNPELADNSGVVHIGYYLEMILAAAHSWYGVEDVFVHEMDLVSAMLVLPGEVREVALLVDDPGEDGRQGFRFLSRTGGQGPWTPHAEGRLSLTRGPEPGVVDLDGTSLTTKSLSGDEVYEVLTARGFRFGTSVRWLDRLWIGDRDAVVRFLPAGKEHHALPCHPGVLDSCAQVFNILVGDQTPKGTKYMVNRLDNVALRVSREGDERTLFARVSDVRDEGNAVSGGFCVTTTTGQPVISAGGIRLAAFDEERLGRMKALLESASVGTGEFDASFRQQFDAASEGEHSGLVCDYLVALLSETLGMDTGDVKPDDEIKDLGLDSMSGLVLLDRIREKLGAEIQMTDLVHCRVVQDLAESVTKLLSGRQTSKDVQLAPPDADMSLGHWIRSKTRSSQARVRLFCFPNGYRSADLFDEWQDILGPTIDVAAVKLPGLDGERMEETCPLDVDECVDLVRRAVDPELLDLPVATFGHSWGSLFSYRLAHLLEKTASVPLVKCFVSGYTPVDRENGLIGQLKAELLTSGLSELPTPEEARTHKPLRDAVVRAFVAAWGYTERDTLLTLPMLLGACCLIDRYQHDPASPLRAPLTAFHGIDDYGVTMAEMEGWTDLTSGQFSLFTVAGDHQFINKHQSEADVLRHLKRDLLSGLDDIDHPVAEMALGRRK